MKKLAVPFLLAVIIIGLVVFVVFSTNVLNQPGPRITHIETSTKTITKECSNRSITITANIMTRSGIKSAILWHRIEENQPYTKVEMERKQGNIFSVTVKGADIPGRAYGTWEFYITAEDNSGNKVESKINKSVKMINCIT